MTLTREAVDAGADQELDTQERSFLYMPLMHSETMADHELATQLFDQPEMEMNLAYEIKHKEIIERFSRYPHRNAALGRPSSEAELRFLASDEGRFWTK